MDINYATARRTMMDDQRNLMMTTTTTTTTKRRDRLSVVCNSFHLRRFVFQVFRQSFRHLHKYTFFVHVLVKLSLVFKRKHLWHTRRVRITSYPSAGASRCISSFSTPGKFSFSSFASLVEHHLVKVPHRVPLVAHSPQLRHVLGHRLDGLDLVSQQLALDEVLHVGVVRLIRHPVQRNQPVVVELLRAGPPSCCCFTPHTTFT